MNKVSSTLLGAAWLFSIVFWLGSNSPCEAHAYHDHGKVVSWTQPNGFELSLCVVGGEYYARTETHEGYTVVLNPADSTYYYAVVAEDGSGFVPTETRADEAAPEGLEKHIELAPEVRQALREAKREIMAPHDDERWQEQVDAAQLRRAAELGLEDPSELAASGPQLAPVSGNVVGLTILVQFPDDPVTTGTTDPTNFPTTQAKVDRYANEVGYNDDGNTGSVRDFFSDQSANALDYTQQVTQVVTVPHARDYYNYSNYPDLSQPYDPNDPEGYPTVKTLRGAGAAGRILLADAVAELQAQSFDFSGLTLKSGDRVMATNVFFAGGTSGSWSNGLWPHRWVMSPQINVGTAQSPIYIYDYQITNAPDAAIKVGTFIHENGHMLLGYPDLYDYGGESAGVGRHCVMGSGNHLNGGRTPAPLNGYFKDISGWSNVVDTTASAFFTATLPTTGNQGYRIRKPGTSTEYFLIENRGNGDPWAAHVPDKGIAIWHIDETENGTEDQQMTEAQHYEVSLEQADGDFDLETSTQRGDSGDLYDNTTQNFTDGTVPDARWWDGSSSGIIIDVLSAPGANMDVTFGSILPEIAVEQPSGSELVDGTSSVGFVASGVGVPVVKTFTIRNTGNSDLTGLALIIDGTGSSDFSATALGQTSLAAGSSLTFDVAFTPSSAAATSAALHIASSDADENPFDIALSGVVRGLLGSDGFETGLEGWTNSSGYDFNWTRKSGGTTSSGTGPNGASEGSYYIYTEASSPNHPSKTAAIEKAFDLSGFTNVALYFDYHMYGDTMGTLFLDVYNGSTWQEGVWSLSGTQQGANGDAWRQAQVDLSTYNDNPDVRLRFRGTTTSSWTSDHSIDEVELHGLVIEYDLTYTAGPGGAISGSAFQSVAHGADGTPVEATPNTNFRFVDWSDGSTQNPRTDLSVTEVISVTANFEQNFPPTFSGYTIGVDEEETAVVSFGKLLVGVTDPEGHTFSVTSAGPASTQGGTVTLGGSSITYDAPIGVSGSDSFQVTVTDQFGGAATASVTVTIRPAAGSSESHARNPATVTMNESNHAEVRFHGIPGRQYRVQRSTDLNSWTDLGTITASTNGEVFHTDTSPPQGSAFYRLAR